MSVEDQAKALDSDDAELRRQAIVALRGSTDEAAAPLVMRGLGDDDWRVRKEAVALASEAATSLGLTDALVHAISQGENVGLRNAALDVLEALGPQAAPQLMKALPTVPEHARKFIVEALGESGGSAVLDELSVAVASADPNVAGEAIEALARIGGAEAERLMRERLTSSDTFLRMAALDGLNRLRAIVPFAEIEPLLEDRLIRRVALSALGRTKQTEAIPPLMDALREAGLAVQAAAALGLVQLGDDSYELKLAVAEHLEKADDRVRDALRGLLDRAQDLSGTRAAAQLVTMGRDPKAVAATMRLAGQDAIAPSTLEAFRSWGTDAIVPLLDAMADLDDPKGQAFALELASDLAALAGELSGARAERIRRALSEALQDADARLALAAARCMGAWAGAADAAVLVRVALAGESDVARAAGGALRELVRRDADAVRQAFSGVSLARGGAPLVPAAAALGGQDAVEHLQSAVTADDADTRRAAVAALAEVGGAGAADMIALALADEDGDVQAEAAAALGKVRGEDGGASGVDALVLALSSEASHVRAAAARALGRTGASQVVDALSRLVTEADVGVAVAAVDAIGKLAPDGLTGRLAAALHHADSEVVKAALSALAPADTSSRTALVNALEHPAWDVRRLAAELLGEGGLQGSAKYLEKRLEHETDDFVAGSLRASLGVLQGLNGDGGED